MGRLATRTGTFKKYIRMLAKTCVSHNFFLKKKILFQTRRRPWQRCERGRQDQGGHQGQDSYAIGKILGIKEIHFQIHLGNQRV